MLHRGVMWISSNSSFVYSSFNLEISSPSFYGKWMPEGEGVGLEKYCTTIVQVERFSKEPVSSITWLYVCISTILGPSIAIQIKIGQWQLAYYFIQIHTTRLVTTGVLFDLELYLKTAYQVIKQCTIPYSRGFKELHF